MSLAKYAAPRLTNIVPRPRLYGQLDELRTRQRSIWLHAQAGAGKTSLAAAWLKHADLVATWFRADTLDRANETLFEYLAGAVAPAALPALEKAFQKDLPAFARRFFKLYFAAMPPESVLLLDDLHHLDLEAQAELLAILFDSVPTGMTVLVTSRLPPPAELRDKVAVLGWDALRFDDKEGAMLAGIDGAGATAQGMLQLADGWAAAIVLLRRQHALAPSAAMQNTEVFDYLASELFEHLPPKERGALMALSLLPDVTEEDARALLGDESGAAILQRIHHDGLLVDRRESDLPRYTLHTLLREFLASQAARLWHDDERKLLQTRAATLLFLRGDWHKAASLFHSAENFAALARVLEEKAPSLELRADQQAWLAWIEQLPAAMLAQDPWLQALRGQCLLQLEDSAGMDILVRAEQGLRAQGKIARLVIAQRWQFLDIAGRSALGKVRIEEAIAPLLRLLDTIPSLGDADATLAAQAYATAVYGCGICNVQDHDLAALAQRAMHYLQEVHDPFTRLSCVHDLAVCAPVLPAPLVTAAISTATGAAGLADLRELAHVRPAAVRRFAVRAHWALFFVLAELSLGEQYHELCIELEQRWGLGGNVHVDPGFLLVRRRLKEAAAAIDDYRLKFAMHKGQSEITIRLYDAFFAMQSGDHAGALELAKAALDIAKAAGYPPGRRFEADLFTIFFAALAGEHALARQLIEEYSVLNVGSMNRNMQVIGLLIDGDAAAQAGDIAAARPPLVQALALHRLGAPVFMLRFAPLAERVLDVALRLDIEREHVLGIVRRQELRAPQAFLGHWPWPIAVRTLGEFGLAFHGKDHVFRGKVPHKPLQLLKLLAQAPQGRMRVDQLYELMWPTIENPQPAFQIALHRLRDLLGSDEAVTLLENDVELHTARVWTDVAALQACAAHVQGMRTEAPLHDLHQAADALFDLYRGAFLANEDLTPWITEARARCSQRLHDTAVALASRLQAAGASLRALDLYRLALQAEPLAEDSWRSCMRCADACGERAVAQEAWERCRRNLSILIGRQPSEETQALAHQLGLH